MAFINLEGEDVVRQRATVKITPGDYYVYTRNSRTHYRYYPVVPVGVSGLLPGRIMWRSGEGYMYVIDSPTQTIYKELGTEFTFTLNGTENTKELVTPSIQGGGALVPSSWRTKVKALPKSNLAISYDETASCDFKCNGHTIQSVSANYIGMPGQIIVEYSTNTISGDFEEHTEGSREWKIEMSYSGWAWDKHLCTALGANGQFYHFEANGHNISINGAFITAPSMGAMVASIGSSSSNAYNFRYKVDADCFPPKTNTASLRFKSDESVYNYNTNQWELVEWTGLTSPIINYNTNTLYLGTGIPFTDTTRSVEPPFTMGMRWEIPRHDLPDRIGNVTLLNPESVNDYEISIYDDEGEVVDTVRNNICKLTPELEGNDSMSVYLTPKILFKSEDLEATNCINVIDADHPLKYRRIKGENKDEVPADATLSIDNLTHEFYNDEGLRDVDSNATLPDDYLSPELTAIYRQKHFTKFRYLQVDLTERVQIGTTEDIFGREVPVYEWRLPEGISIELECKDYGNVTGRKWNYTLNAVAYNEDENLFNIPLVDLTRQSDYEGQRYNSTDNYIENYSVEDLHIKTLSEPVVDPNTGEPVINPETGEPIIKEANMVYREELPCYSDTQTPNLVSKVVIHLVKGKTYRLGQIKGFFAPNNYIHNTDKSYVSYNLVADEFKEPVYVGDHNPHIDIMEQDQNHAFYLDRYVKGIVNGKDSYEIPDLSMEQMPNYEIDEYRPLLLGNIYANDLITGGCGHQFHYSLSDGIHCPSCNIPFVVSNTVLKDLGSRGIYPRDDLGEILFNIDDTEPDADGHYPINCIYNGKTTYISFLRPRKGNAETHSTDNIGIASEVRVDTLSGSQLSRYLNRFDTIRVVADYGGFVSGLASVRDTDIVASPSSKFNTKQNWFNNIPIGRDWYLEKIGTATTIKIENDNANLKRTITPVIDGDKYNYSFFWNMFYLLYDDNGNLLVDKYNRLLYGLGKVFDEEGDD